MPKRNPLNFDSQDLQDNLNESAGRGVDALFRPAPQAERSEAETGKVVYSNPVGRLELPPASPAPAERPDQDDLRPNERAHERAGARPVDRSTERSVPAQKRSTKRHSFEFYEDQFMRLKKISLEHGLRGETISMSDIVRDALDAYFDSREKSERTTERPVERTVERSDERTEKSAA